jgi:hypothetical protein
MAIPRTYATAGAFRRALEERLKSMSKTEQIDMRLEGVSSEFCLGFSTA